MIWGQILAVQGFPGLPNKTGHVVCSTDKWRAVGIRSRVFYYEDTYRNHSNTLRETKKKAKSDKIYKQKGKWVLLVIVMMLT